MPRQQRAWQGRIVVTLAICLLITAGGCRAKSDRLSVSGRVTWQAKPLEKGSILFVPGAGHRGPKVGAVIENGSYQIDKERGPTAGPYRVEVRADTGEHPHSPTDKPPNRKRGSTLQMIPLEYNEKSQLTADVSQERTRFDFDLPVNRHGRRDKVATDKRR